MNKRTESTEKKESKYAKKRRSGNMMYGPHQAAPKYPNFEVGKVRVFCNCEPPHVYNRCQHVARGKHALDLAA